MVNKKDNDYYIKKVLVDLNFLIKHTKDLTKSKFEQNEILLDSIMWSTSIVFVVIGLLMAVLDSY